MSNVRYTGRSPTRSRIAAITASVPCRWTCRASTMAKPWLSSLVVRKPIWTEQAGSTKPSRAACQNMVPWSMRLPSSSGQVSLWASKWISANGP
ncbi:hypothetical protein D3C80_1781090 [compost metagenome]